VGQVEVAAAGAVDNNDSDGMSERRILGPFSEMDLCWINSAKVVSIERPADRWPTGAAPGRAAEQLLRFNGTLSFLPPQTFAFAAAAC
jgi:hypothetical protein